VGGIKVARLVDGLLGLKDSSSCVTLDAMRAKVAEIRAAGMVTGAIGHLFGQLWQEGAEAKQLIQVRTADEAFAMLDTDGNGCLSHSDLGAAIEFNVGGIKVARLVDGLLGLKDSSSCVTLDAMRAKVGEIRASTQVTGAIGHLFGQLWKESAPAE